MIVADPVELSLMDMQRSFLTSDAFEETLEVLMEFEIDVERLRRDLKDYYGTAMSGMMWVSLAMIVIAGADDVILMR